MNSKRTAMALSMIMLAFVPLTSKATDSRTERVEFAKTQQNGVVKGTVIDNTGEPVIGASVIVKGTTNGTVTDVDGAFSISDVKKGDIIQVSFIGYVTVEVPFDGKPLNITLKEDTQSLQEVVVTAMGIERKAKSLTYATQKVGGDELTRAKETNMINSLQGKTAGLSITPNSSGAGGSSKLVIRGNKSAQGNNQPLIVIDGMPMSNTTTTQAEGVYGGRDGGDALSNLNPDDIASINVLKGASAAALYGSMAANGVVLITTKKGSAGTIKADFSSNITLETPLDTPDLQSTYGAKVNANGSLDEYSWGDKISGTAKGKDRVSDFYRTGASYINSFSISGGTEKVQSYASYANTTANGIMPTNSFQRHNMMMKQSYKMLDDRLTVDASLNYINQKAHNRPRTGMYNNPLFGLYTFPANGDWSYYKNNYSVYDANTMDYPTQEWYVDVNNDHTANPYWVLNKVASDERRNRIMASGTVKFKITDYLNIQGRLNYDRTSDEYERKTYAGTSTTIANAYGGYEKSIYNFRQFYGDVMLNFSKEFGQFSVNAALGSSFTDYLSETWNLANGGSRYLPNYFVVENGDKNGSSMSMSRKRLNAVFGTAQLGFRDYLFLDFTARNDWSSTLAYTPNGSYFYPSVGLTGVVSDMFTMPESINLMKVRASYSIVGNEMPAFITHNLNGFSNGSVSFKTTMPFTDMKPEKLHSMEFGVDMSMLDSRLDFDVTYYKTNNKNQYFSMSVPSATGYSEYYFNAGDIQNQGVEATISWNQSFNNDWRWKTGFNISYNDNKIKALDNRKGVAESEKLTRVYQGGMYGYELYLYEGGSYGDIYAKDFLRDESTGLIKVNDGTIQYTDDMVKLGCVNSKWGLGWNNTVSYKDFSLYMLIDGKIGGDYIDATQASLNMYGVTEESAKARDNGGVEVYDISTNTVTKMDAQSFFTQIGSKNGGGGSYYVYSQTNFRLRELSFGYTFRDLLGNGKNLSLNLVGRNLFFIYKDCPCDPDVSMSTSNGYNGSSYYNLPSTRSYGFNLKLSF